MVLLNTGTPGTSRETYSEDADGENLQPLALMIFNVNQAVKHKD